MELVTGNNQKYFISDTEDLMASQTLNNNNTCIFRNQEPNVISFFNDQQIREDVVEFPAGAVLVSRCVDIGKYAMIGECNLNTLYLSLSFSRSRSLSLSPYLLQLVGINIHSLCASVNIKYIVIKTVMLPS